MSKIVLFHPFVPKKTSNLIEKQIKEKVLNLKREQIPVHLQNMASLADHNDLDQAIEQQAKKDLKQHEYK